MSSGRTKGAQDARIHRRVYYTQHFARSNHDRQTGVESVAGTGAGFENAVNELARRLACQQAGPSDSIERVEQHGRERLQQSHWRCHCARVQTLEGCREEDDKS